MEISGPGKSPNTSLSFRYTANNEALEELYHISEDDPPSPPCDSPPCVPSENASPKKADKSSSLLDKYFKSMRTEKLVEKVEDKAVESKTTDEARSTPVPKEVTSSPVKEYLNRLGKRTSTPSDVTSDVKDKDSNETWKIFHDFKYKIAQAVEDIKTRSLEETKDKSVPRENSTSDSEENSAVKDDQQSVGDTDNQVSSLESSIQNLSDMTQPLTAKATERESSLPNDNKNNSESSDDTHKNLVHSDSLDASKDLFDDNMLDVESGVEALEDSNIDCFGDASNLEVDCPDAAKPTDLFTPKLPPTPTNFGFPPSKNNLKPQTTYQDKGGFLSFSMYFLTFFLFINYILFPNSNIWNGFLLGIWFFYCMSTLKQWLLDNYFSDWEPSKNSYFQLKRTDTTPIAYTIPSVKEYTPMKKYEGWINHYRYPDYDPYTYHINKTTTAFMKLEGCNLRISYTRTKIAKKALWDEKIEKVAFYQHRLYNLTGARVILLPKGLVKRRQWSKKYPICIILNENEKIQVLEKENVTDKKNLDTPDKKKEQVSQPEVESIETNTSPEKKKKFVWRKREKSISSENETGKEGLRHRFARKMHRDKKTDSVSTYIEPESHSDKNLQDDFPFQEAEMESTKSVCSTKDDADEELDENELSKLKDFLEEAETETGGEGATEGEWSVHVKHSVNKHSRLYLLARTGRDKHEWYRRLMIAVTDANAASAESSAADDKTATSDSLAETKEGIEMALYKVAEKDITFTKATGKGASNVTDSSSISEGKIPSPLLTPDLDSYEKHFWPYLYKIIQPKSPTPDCDCRTLPGSVQWINTVLARLMFDLMRDQSILARVQNRIQRKLHTLKLPSFMSPLTVTELSLSGACPLVARVWPPSADSRGLWLDADLRYDGGACITILTQINLMKLKEKNLTLEDQIFEAEENFQIESESNQSTHKHMFSDKNLRKRKPAVYDSDVEDSAESSSDDESPPIQPVDSDERLPVTPLDGSTPSGNPDGGSSKKKFLRMVDKIATSKYFQQVTDYKYVKRAMEGLSNTDIKLQVEVAALEGRLAINLPPPPHDRIWAGFRTNPRLLLRARPAVGARALRFAHITNWIEQKLTKEFEKVLVLPNMEDIVVDIMTPTPVHFE